MNIEYITGKEKHGGVATYSQQLLSALEKDQNIILHKNTTINLS